MLKKRFAVCVAMVAVVVALVFSGVVSGVDFLGGMTGNNGTDTTFTFTYPVSKVLIVNPDAACTINARHSAAGNVAHVVPLPGNTAVWLEGSFTSVLVDKTTTQRVGVYGVQN